MERSVSIGEATLSAKGGEYFVIPNGVCSSNIARPGLCPHPLVLIPEQEEGGTTSALKTP